MDEEIIQQGLIYETSEDDYVLGGEIDVVKLIKERPITDHKSTEYNQKEINNSTCVIHACLGALGKTMNVSFDMDQRKEVFQYCIDLGIFEEGVGISFYKGVDAIRKWWNANNPNNKVISFRLTDLETVKIGLKNGYRIVGGYKGNKEYANDFNKDGILDGTTFKPSTYGHCVSKEGEKTVVDNYIGILKYNKYTIDNIQKLIDSGCWFPAFYIFIEEKMNERKIPYNLGTTPDEKQIVIARLDEVRNEQLRYKKYDDAHYITKMLIDLDRVR